MKCQFIGGIFESIRDQACSDLQQFLNIEISMMHEQKQGKIRYVGIFQNVRKSMLVVEYFIANCNQICDPKMGGIDIIYKGPVWETYRWLLGVSQKESKYTSLVQMENTFWMLEEMNRI